MDYQDESATSWRDDMQQDLVHEFLSRILGAAEVAEVDLPHIVVCRDEETGAISYSGPFADGITALVFAERESTVDRELNDGTPLTFVAAALYPPERTVAG